MEAKTAVIIGSVALLGVGAFIYFKPKKTSTASGNTTGTGTTGSGTISTSSTPTQAQVDALQAQADALQNQVNNATPVPSSSGTVLTTPTQVLQTVSKIKEANDILEQIKSAKAEIIQLKAQSGVVFSAVLGYSLPKIDYSGQIAIATSNLNGLRSQLIALGYKEDNGNLVKIR
jgi:hypothetical protein